MHKAFYLQKKFNIIIIAPKIKYIKKIEQALIFLKKEDKNSFRKVIKNLKIIFIVPVKGYKNMMFLKDKIWFSYSGFFEDKDVPYQYLASLLLHEAQHIVRYKRGNKPIGYYAEKEAYLAQRKFLLKIKYNNYVEWLDSEFKKRWWQTPSQEMKEIFVFDKFLKAYKENRLKLIKV